MAQLGLLAAVAACAIVAGLAFRRAAVWQSRLRALMDMPPLEASRLATVLGVTMVVLLLLVLLTRLIRGTWRPLPAWLARHLPGPQAAVIALAATALLFWSIGNGLLVTLAMRAADASFAEVHARFAARSPKPTDPLKTGGPGSLIAWEGIGRAGRAMIAAPPNAETIAAMTGGPALEPLRVCAGLNSADTARAVFAAIHDHWRGLPADRRPRLYLYGLSLGAFNSDLSHDLHQVIAAPYHGAHWAGPPFPSRTWSAVTRARNPGSPSWRPTIRDGSVIRFTAQTNHLGEAAASWSPCRVIFLQYASDAVTFFDPRAIWRRPESMTPPLGPDVSPDLIRVPVVTFLQLAIDLMTAVLPPRGFGHSSAFDHSLDAWAALTDAPGWTPGELAALKARVAAARCQAPAPPAWPIPPGRNTAAGPPAPQGAPPPRRGRSRAGRCCARPRRGIVEAREGLR